MSGWAHARRAALCFSLLVATPAALSAHEAAGFRSSRAHPLLRTTCSRCATMSAAEAFPAGNPAPDASASSRAVGAAEGELWRPFLSIPINGQVVSAEGVLMATSVYLVAILVQLPIVLAYLWSRAFDQQRRRSVDWIIHFWAATSMRICGFSPDIQGVENLPPAGQACVYVPNHSSFLDILTLTGFIPRPMKYIAEEAILNIPFIGWPMRLAGHIALARGSRRSQVETFKKSLESLGGGNSLIVFPEGGRSANGRLKGFRGGPFKMASKCGVPIVPISICGLQRWYPKGSLLPVAVPKGVRVVVHPPIDVCGSGLSEAEALERAYAAINSALPEHQKGPSTPPHAED